MKEVPSACGLVIGAGKRRVKHDGYKWGCGASWRSRNDFKLEKRVEAGSEIWLLKHSGAFQMLLAAHIPETLDFGRANP